MGRMFSWLKKATSGAIDPQRASRVNALSASIYDAINRDRDRFELTQLGGDAGHFKEDVIEAAEKCYDRFTSRALADGVLSDGERKTLDWIAGKLRIDPPRASTLRNICRRRVLLETWNSVLRSQHIEPPAVERLLRLSKTFALPAAWFGDPETRDAVMAAARSAFALHAPTFRYDNVGWKTFALLASAVALSETELISLNSKLASGLLDELVANSVADGSVSDDERKQIAYWIQTFRFDRQRQASIDASFDRINLIRDVNSGRLPSLEVNRLGLRAGEIVHAHIASRYLKPRRRQGATYFETVPGTLTVTDCRLIFIGAAESVEASHRKVQNLEATSQGFAVICSGRGSGQYEVDDPALILTIYQAAVRRTNQTLVTAYDPVAARAIPRDVRQRVWQRYGGHCADCHAADYLEFDHIVPVAKGGSNSEANVQLLCRRCNSKKSDRI